MRDEVLIKNLTFYAHHGVYQQETLEGQQFILNAKLFFDMDRAVVTDEIEDTVHYGMVCEFLVDFLTRNTYHLLEAAVTDAARATLLEFDRIREMEITLEKPDAPIDLEFESVAVSRTIGWHWVAIALGSNMGDKKKYIDGAVRKLKKHPFCREVEVSDLIETKPYGGVEQDDFLNGAAIFETLLSPMELLKVLQDMEKAAGRKRTVHWGPRTLDLDILLYDDLILSTKALTIPHPDMENRSFVLAPLAQLAPYVRHPIYKKTIQRMLDDLS